ncbi:hypothetical protein HRF87_03790 [Bacillus sp. CRN 9]|nr:hypothetical protein [Bacillus sp. CRN 9]
MNKEERVKHLKDKIQELNERMDQVAYNRGEYPIEEDIQEDEVHYDELEELGRELSGFERELREIEYNEEEEFRREELRNLIHKEGYIIRDKESTSDLLSRLEHAQEISKLLSNKQTLTPLTLGIYGNWGEGKSTFLRLIETELGNINKMIEDSREEEIIYNKTHVVRFDASEYNDQDKIWYSMLSQLFAKYEEEVGILAKVKYGLGMFKRSFNENKWNYIINISLLVLFLIWIFVYSKDKSILEVITENDVIINILGVISTFTVATNIVLPIIKRLKFLTKPMSDNLISQLKYPDYKDLLGTREKVKENLDVLIKAWTKRSGDKIVVLVDELDRCSEETIVEFFEALQLFLPVDSIVHVIAINEETVCFALANNNIHYFDKEFVPNSEKLAFGKNYLEKYITIPYYLPYENSYNQYINHLLSENSSNDYYRVFTEAEKEILIKIIMDVSKTQHITPREMKKIINLLLLSKERLININKKKEKGIIVKFEEHLSWFLLKYFYSDASNQVINYLKMYYRNNKYKKFKEISSNLLYRKEFNESPKAEQVKKLFKYIDELRVDYILISNKISETLIVTKK